MKSRLPHRRSTVIRPQPATTEAPSFRPEDFFGDATVIDSPAPSTPPRRRLRIALATGAVVLLAVVAAAVWFTRPTIAVQGPAELVADPTPLLEVRVDRALWLDAADVRVEVDGAAIDGDRVQVRGGARISVQLPRLDDGEHRVGVRVVNTGVLRRTLRVERAVQVDTTAPEATLGSPRPSTRSAYVGVGVAAVTELPLQVTARVEDGSSVEVDSDATGMEPVRSDGTGGGLRTVSADLPQGAQGLQVRVRDAAGNETVLRRRVIVDTVGPRLRPALPRTVRRATLGLDVRGADPHGVRLAVLVDGKPVEDGVTTTARTEAPNAAGASSPNATPTEPDDEQLPAPVDDELAKEALPVAATFRIELAEPLMEGRHTLTLVATDSIGARTKVERVVIVDSTEQLATASGLRGGSVGADVVELQRGLINRKAATSAQLQAEISSRSYGVATRTAVQRFQSAQGIEADGVAGSDTLATLTLKIVIDRGGHTLTLYRSGKVVKTYGVAVGSPKYPTPAGSFRIQTMQENPTWTPPDSEWAKDAEVIPPGPDNPLGTRWMAINGTVGIHGTNNPASVGYSVSHGCIRMRIPDVEDLFSRVRVGTPVSVV